MSLDDIVNTRLVSRACNEAVSLLVPYGITLESKDDIPDLLFLLNHIPHSQLSVLFGKYSTEVIGNGPDLIHISRLGRVRKLNLTNCIGNIDETTLGGVSPNVCKLSGSVLT
jgi:hypothetical protein